ncbi:hypothetical protein DM02DRAFT_600717 [Periconia macrospinosa]|uniref:Pentatricopeptide repeat protein n=1 Tax=Periconia macrospinosa TaxID=97972 RepID=A0A2V1DD44_9PLEO|nr:hypothetical protein DM02DRAFT_600717 [Periconia macrospinosa]
MSLLHTLDRTLTVSTPTYTRPFLTFLYPAWCNSEPPRRCFSRSAVNRPPRLPRASGESSDNFFIHALARAASCPQHRIQIPHKTSGPGLPRAKRQGGRKRKGRTADEPEERRFRPFRRVRQFAQRELKALVDYYGPGFEDYKEEIFEDDSPLVWNVGDDHQPWPFKNPQDEDSVKRLEELLKNEEASHTDVFDTYKQLPAPGVAYLTANTIRRMLHHLSVLERPTPTAMQRFLSILDDMKYAHIHVTRSEWTTAIYLAGRFMGTVTSEHVNHALQLWRDMEKRAGIRGGVVTMNVLFDIAVRAGKYQLAETFLREMEYRRIRYHRHFRVSLIYFHGVQQNSDAVRKTYHDLVTTGEIVDVVVLNAVIAALLRCGEPSAAEHVFERMKRLAAIKDTNFFAPDAPLRFNMRIWRGRRTAGLHITKRSRELMRKNAPEDAAAELKDLQDAAPVAPNSRTYSLLIRHAAHTTGDLDRIMSLLREMGYNAVPVEGTTFIVILHGFCSFGGVRYSGWTLTRLEQTWQEYLGAVEQKLERTWVSRLAIVAALRAFHKCGAGEERLMRVWEEAKGLWVDAQPDEIEGCLRILRMLVRKRT